MDQEAVKTVRIVIDASGAKDGADDVKNALASIDDKVGGVGSSMKGIGDAVTSVFKGILAYVAFDKIVDGIRNIVAAMDKLQRQAETLKVTTDWLQGFQAAAVSAGVKIDDATAALNKFAGVVGNAALGGQKAVDTMKDLGIRIFDAAGQVRPINDLFVEAARKISGMSEAAKANALSMQAMGKSAQTVMPMLEKVSELTATGGPAKNTDIIAPDVIAKMSGGNSFDKGIADLERLTNAATGAVTPETVRNWANLSTQWEKLMLQLQNFAANNLFELVNFGFRSMTYTVQGLLVMLQGVIAAFRTIHDLFAKNTAPAAVISGLQAGIAERETVRQRAIDFQANPFQSVANYPGVDVTNPKGQVDQLTQEIDAMRARVDDLTRQQRSDSGKATRGDELTTPPVPTPPPGGASFAVARSAGENLSKRIAQMQSDASLGTAGALSQIGQTNLGADAVAALETHMKDLKEVTDAYIKSGVNAKIVTDQQTGAVLSNVAAINQIVEGLDKQNDATRRLINLKAFALQTNELKDQNAELAQQLAMTGATSNEIQRQTALRKAYDEETKLGLMALANSNADGAAGARKDIADRTTQINQQYQLKEAIESTARSTQLWLAPFAAFLSSLQTGIEGFFEKVFSGGTVTWQSMVDTMKQSFTKMLAQLATIAVGQTIIAPVVQSIFSPGTAQSLGFGASGGGFGGLANIFGLGGTGTGVAPGVTSMNGSVVSTPGGGGLGMSGLANMFGGSGGSSFFSGISNWLQTPFTGPMSGISAADMAGVMPGMSGAQASSYFGGLQGGGMLSGMTPGSVLGGVSSIGMGAMNAFSGKGTGSTIGGIAQMAGGVMMMVPGLQVPGAILSMLGGLGGMFDGGPQTPPQPSLVYGSGSFSFNPSTGKIMTGGDSLNGGTQLNAQAGSIAAQVMGLIQQTGGTVENGKLYGGYIAAGTNHVLNGNQWQGQNYTQGGYMAPDGTSTSIAYNSSQSLQQTAEQVIGAVFQQDLLNGGVTGVGSTLMKILQNGAPGSTQEASTDITMSKAYDELGQTMTSSEQAINQVTQSFHDLTVWAANAGLSLDPIMKAQSDAQIKVATDFSKSISQGILGITDPLQAQLNALDDAYQAAVKEANWLNDNVQGAFVDMAQVSKYYTMQMAQVQEQYYAQTLGNLETLIKNLTYGSLSGASPATTLSATQSAYQTTLAGAQGNDQTSIANIAGVAQDYLTAQRNFSGSGAQYYQVVGQVLAELQQLDFNVRGGSVTPSTSDDDTPQAQDPNAPTIAALQALVIQQGQQISQLIQQNATTNSLLERALAN